MTPTLLVIGALFLFGGGVGVGVAVSRDRTADVVERQTELIGELQDGQRALVEAAGKPVVIDAEVRASLSKVPPACITELGGDPMSAQCALLQCWAMGNTTAQRPSCSDVEAAAIAEYQNGRSSSDMP